MLLVSYDKVIDLFEENGWVLFRTQIRGDLLFHVFQEPKEGFLWNIQIFDKGVSNECFRKIKEYFKNQTQ